MKAYQKLGMAIALIGSGSAVADPIFDNISGINSYGEGIGIYGDSYIAKKFSTLSLCPNGCILGDVTLTLTSLDGSTTGYSLEIFSDNANVPGTSLVSFKNPNYFSTSFGNDTFKPNASLTLANNTFYWVRFSTTSFSPTYWNNLSNANVQGQPTDQIYNINGFEGSQSSPSLLMKVEATPVPVQAPVPATIWMMGTALLGFVTTRLKRVS